MSAFSILQEYRCNHGKRLLQNRHQGFQMEINLSHS